MDDNIMDNLGRRWGVDVGYVVQHEFVYKYVVFRKIYSYRSRNYLGGNLPRILRYKYCLRNLLTGKTESKVISFVSRRRLVLILKPPHRCYQVKRYNRMGYGFTLTRQATDLAFQMSKSNPLHTQAVKKFCLGFDVSVQLVYIAGVYYMCSFTYAARCQENALEVENAQEVENDLQEDL